jgi:hypothetical protein
MSLINISDRMNRSVAGFAPARRWEIQTFDKVVATGFLVAAEQALASLVVDGKSQEFDLNLEIGGLDIERIGDDDPNRIGFIFSSRLKCDKHPIGRRVVIETGLEPVDQRTQREHRVFRNVKITEISSVELMHHKSGRTRIGLDDRLKAREVVLDTGTLTQKGRSFTRSLTNGDLPDKVHVEALKNLSFLMQMNGMEQSIGDGHEASLMIEWVTQDVSYMAPAALDYLNESKGTINSNYHIWRDTCLTNAVESDPALVHRCLPGS